MNAVRMCAPAKVNLGLAVLGKRPDGYHNIDTIMAMIDLVDVLAIHRVDMPGITIAGMEDVPPESNVIGRAIDGFCSRAGIKPAFHIDVDKRIPSPAGLGGGSSDAAATLKALAALFPAALGADDLHEVAASIGADCPFFLGPPAARATGTGTTLRPIPPASGWIVIVVPGSTLEAKTARLYASLRPDDYLSTAHIDRIEGDIQHLRPQQLVNSFTRAAKALLPGVDESWKALIEVAGTCALTGAGPAVYALAEEEHDALAWRDQLVHLLPGGVDVIVSKFLAASPVPEPLT